jgi:hypothetical protein
MGSENMIEAERANKNPFMIHCEWIVDPQPVTG